VEDLATAEFHHVPDADCLFDLGFGNFVFRRSWENLASDYNSRRGGRAYARLFAYLRFPPYDPMYGACRVIVRRCYP
jgi:hypothetical protein